MPVETPIMMTEALGEDIAMLQQMLSARADNMLERIHLSEAFIANDWLALLAFAKTTSDPQRRISDAPSTSLVDFHVYLEPVVFAQITDHFGSSRSRDASVVASILALRVGAQLPLIGHQLVQLEEAQSGDYMVVELTPLIGRIVYFHTGGYKKEVTDQAD